MNTETKEMREIRTNMEYQNYFYFLLNTKMTNKELEKLLNNRKQILL